MGLTSAMKRFQKDFSEETETMLVLTGESAGGAGLYEKGIWEPSADLLAWMDGGTLHREKGHLCWLVEEKDRNGWVYHLKPLTIYKVTCRKNLHTNAWMLLKVLERDLRQPDLDDVLAEYIRPVSFTDEQCGEFTLERRFNWFTRELDWLGKRCLVFLECDGEDGETATGALAAFKRVYEDAAAWDKRFRDYAALELTELANDWQEAYDGISQEDFAGRISLSEFSMDPDGAFTVYYDDGDLFYGHVIVITGDIENGFDGADIAG